MAANPPQDVNGLTRITIDNRNIKDMAENLRFATQDMARFSRALKGAMGDLSFFTTGVREVGKKGQMTQDFYVPTDMEKVALEAVKREAGAIFGAMKDANGNPIGRDYFVSSRKSNVAKGSISLAGEDAFKELQNRLRAIGGEAYRPDLNRPDDVSFYYPTSRKSGSKMFMAEQESLLSGARELSARELRIRADKLTVSTNKAMEKADKEEKKLLSKLEKEAKNSLEENVEKAGQAGGVEGQVTSFLILKIIAIITVIADITRRILTAVINQAERERKDMASATSLGVPIQTIKRNRYEDTAHGLDSETTNTAIMDIQSKFGDVTNLDEKSLAILARVMGEEVADLVKSGMGGETPDVLLDKILDKYTEQFRQGKNSLGQDVGQEQALRELTTVLNKVSPSIASIFSAYGRDFLLNPASTGTYSEWREDVPRRSKGTSNAFYENVDLMAKQISILRSNFSQLSDLIKDNLIVAVGSLAKKLNDFNIGKTSAEVLATNRSNKQKAQLVYTMQKATLSSDIETLKQAFAREGIEFDLDSQSVTDYMKYAGVERSMSAEEIERARRDKKYFYKLMHDPAYSKEREALTRALGIESVQEQVEFNATTNTGSKYDESWGSTYALQKAGEKSLTERVNFLVNENKDTANARKQTGSLFNMDIMSAIAGAVGDINIFGAKFDYNKLEVEHKENLKNIIKETYKATGNANILDWVQNANEDDPLLKILYSKTKTKNKEDLLKSLGQDGEGAEYFAAEALAEFLAWQQGLTVGVKYDIKGKNAKAFYRNIIKRATQTVDEQAKTASLDVGNIEDKVRNQIIGVEEAKYATYTVSTKEGSKKAVVNIQLWDKENRKLKDIPLEYNLSTGALTTDISEPQRVEYATAE